MIDSVPFYSSVAVTAASTSESNFLAVDLSAKTTWRYFVLHTKVTNGATATRPGDKLTIYYAVSSFAGAADASTVRGAARSFTVPLRMDANGVTISASMPIDASGSTLYIWLAHEGWTADRTISMTAGGY